jgi:hypothetical protein
MARLRRRGWNSLDRRPRSDTLHRPKKYPENAVNAMKLRRLPGSADRHPAASDTIAKVAAMAALRPLLRADPITIGHAGWSRSTPDAQAMKLLAVCLRGPVVGSSGAVRSVFFYSAGPMRAAGYRLKQYCLLRLQSANVEHCTPRRRRALRRKPVWQRLPFGNRLPSTKGVCRHAYMEGPSKRIASGRIRLLQPIGRRHRDAGHPEPDRSGRHCRR